MPLLRTLGPASLDDDAGAPVSGLRRKDLALLALVAAETRPVRRGYAAGLLWSDAPDEARRRHSLSQAVARIAGATGGRALESDGETLRWTGHVAWDGAILLAGDPDHPAVDDALTLYRGDFLEGVTPAAELERWIEAKASLLRTAAVSLLERRGEAAEAAGDWARALRIGMRQAEVDAIWEGGHRRVLRAYRGLGQRSAGARYFRRLTIFFETELLDTPDGETLALGREMGAPPATDPLFGPPPAAPAFALDLSRSEIVLHAATADDAPGALAAPPEPEAGAGSDGPAASAETEEVGAAEGAAETVEREGDAPPAIAPRGGTGRRWIAAALAVAAAGAAVAWWGAGSRLAFGETVRIGGEVYLAAGDTLHRYPDAVTVERCTGMAAARVPVAGRRGRRTVAPLPSVRDHDWLGERAAVTAADGDAEAYVVTGCVARRLRETRDPETVVGAEAGFRAGEAAALAALPRAGDAPPVAARAPGTLVRTPDGALLWVTYHGGALATDTATARAHCRAPAEAHPLGAVEAAAYRVEGRLRPPARGGC